MAECQVDAPVDAHTLREQRRVPRTRVVPDPARSTRLGLSHEPPQRAGVDLTRSDFAPVVVEFDGYRALAGETSENDVH